MTRREILVSFLRGENGFSAADLDSALNVDGTQETTAFLTAAQEAGISNPDLADRLVTFKANGGSGLRTAIAVITPEFSSTGAPVENNNAVLAEVANGLRAVLETIEQALP